MAVDFCDKVSVSGLANALSLPQSRFDETVFFLATQRAA